MEYLIKIKTIKKEKKYLYVEKEEVEAINDISNYIIVGFFIVVNLAIVALTEMLFL